MGGTAKGGRRKGRVSQGRGVKTEAEASGLQALLAERRRRCLLLLRLVRRAPRRARARARACAQSRTSSCARTSSRFRFFISSLMYSSWILISSSCRCARFSFT